MAVMNEPNERLIEAVDTSLLVYGLVLVVLFLAIRYQSRPAEWLRQSATRILVAVGGLFVFNSLLGPMGVHIGLNPWNVAILAVLGLPGLGLLLFLQHGSSLLG